MMLAQTTMIAACLAILIYIAILLSGSYLARDIPNQNPADILSKADSQRDEQIAKSLTYIHKSDTGMNVQTILLHGVNLSSNEFIPLYDSTPFATKGHIELNLPCDSNNPRSPLFQILVGEAPNLTAVTPGYVQQISNPPDMCLYHAQFGFGDPVTDIVLKNISDKPLNLRGPHAIVISTHESYTPTVPSFKELQHKQGY
jgi:hypothetical protein